MIALKNINKVYEDEKGETVGVFDGFDFEIADREITCILGKSGCGKTTLLNILAGVTDYKGEVTFKDTDKINSMSEVNGSVLYDYIKYGLNYIKLVRNVLSYYITKNLIDENGNITRYTNDNEIVQIVVPTDEIDLTVSLDSVLLTD